MTGIILLLCERNGDVSESFNDTHISTFFDFYQKYASRHIGCEKNSVCSNKLYTFSPIDVPT